LKKIELVGFYTYLSCVRETSLLDTQQAGMRGPTIVVTTAKNFLLDDARSFRKNEAKLIPITMEDEAREHF